MYLKLKKMSETVIRLRDQFVKNASFYCYESHGNSTVHHFSLKNFKMNKKISFLNGATLEGFKY